MLAFLAAFALGDWAASNVGEELLEASGDMVEDLVDSVSGSGAIGQVVDIALFPGRVGFRIVTTVFRGARAPRASDRAP